MSEDPEIAKIMQKKLEDMINQKEQPKIEPGIIDLNDSNFEQTISAENPTLVDFWAEWCGPCKQIGPILDEISNEKKDQLKVLKLNIDDSPKTPQKYGVRGIPTLMLFKQGKLVDTKVGSLPKSSLIDWIDNNL